MSWKFKRTINRIREKPFRALKIVRSLQPLIQIVVRVLPKSPFDERRAPSFMFKDGHHIECQRIVRSIGRACISVFAHTHTPNTNGSLTALLAQRVTAFRGSK